MSKIADLPRLDGPAAEKYAQTYLESNGLKCLDNNFRISRGEIDLVMRETEYLVFIEVRYRNSDRFGSADESVSSGKQRRLVLAAQAYLQREGLTDKVKCRFDVVSVKPDSNSGKFLITWHRDAFQPYRL